MDGESINRLRIFMVLELIWVQILHVSNYLVITFASESEYETILSFKPKNKKVVDLFSTIALLSTCT